MRLVVAGELRGAGKKRYKASKLSTLKLTAADYRTCRTLPKDKGGGVYTTVQM